MIRLSLAELLAGGALGSWYLVWKATGFGTAVAGTLPLHLELMLVGWMIQLVIGVGYWILPRHPGHDPERETRYMWLVCGLLNLGLLAAGLSGAGLMPPLWLPAGRLAEALAAALFARHAWHRQRAYRAGARTVLT